MYGPSGRLAGARRRGPERAEIRPVREYGPRRSVELVGRCAYPGGFVGYLGEPSQVAAGGRPLAVAEVGRAML